MTDKKRPSRSIDYQYGCKDEGFGARTPLGRRLAWGPMDDGRLGCQLQSGDRSQLRRSGISPRSTLKAVYIGAEGVTILYDKNRQRIGRPVGMAVDLSVNEWLKAHGVAR